METTVVTFHRMNMLNYVSAANNLGYEPNDSQQTRDNLNQH